MITSLKKKSKTILITLDGSLEKHISREKDSLCHHFDRPKVRVPGGLAIPHPRMEPGITLCCSSVILLEFGLFVPSWREISP